MAAVTLPSNPTNGQTFTVGSTTYTYNSTLGVWDSESPASGGSGTTVYATIAELPLSGNDAGSQAYVSENNRLYLWNGSGWYNIALINTAPAITSGGDGEYLLRIDGVPTVITLVAADPEGLPITWSYAVTSGTLGNTAVVTQNDNVFTITPTTNEADAGQFTITFTASDGVNIATNVNSFTLNFSPTIDYLVVGGGGGGGHWTGGGGGGGGVITGTQSDVQGTTYNVVIGTGGLGSTNSNNEGSNGGNTSLIGGSLNLVAIGGGGGGSHTSQSSTGATAGGEPGGSGGGGSDRGGNTGGAGTSGQGFNGGIGSDVQDLTDGGGGGGGATQAGTNGINSTGGGAGGEGYTSSWTGTAIVYGSGGGGGGSTNVPGGAGGTNAGSGGTTAGGTGGVAYTGSGGGGGGYTSQGGSGTTGTVIFRSTREATSTTGSPTSSIVSGRYIYIFTNDGSITF